MVVEPPDGGIVLAAGSAGQELGLTVRNDGDRPAVDLRAEVTLPPGVRVDGIAGIIAVGAGFAPLVTDGWVCAPAGEHQAACALPELPPRTAVRLVLRVSIDEAFVPADGLSVGLRITGATRVWAPPALPLVVAPSPARLVPAGQHAGVQLVAGRTRTTTLGLVNVGGSPVTADAPATVDLALPRGVGAQAAAPWSCAPEDGTTRCRLPALGPREGTTLTLALTAAGGTAPAGGALEAVLRPAAGRDAARTSVPYTVVRPAAPTLAVPGAVEVALGPATDVPVDVTNTGDLPATGVTVRLTPPAGTPPAAADGCTSEGADVVCRLAEPLAPGATARVVARLTGAAGAVGPLGVVSVAVSADDADLPAPALVAVSGVAPVVTVSDAAAVADGDGGGVLAFVVGAAGPQHGRPGADAADVVARVTLPRGVTYDPDAVVPSTDGCAATDASGREVACDLGRVPAGTTLPVQLNVRVAGALHGTAEIRVTGTGAAEATASVRVVASSANLTPVWSGLGDLDVVEVGAPLLVCRYGPTVPCPSVHRADDNNGLDMRPLDDAPPPGPRSAVPVSSETRLALPAGRPVVWAGLYWSGVRGPEDGWTGDLTTARLRAPDGTWTDVRVGADAVTQVADNAGRSYYQAAADVTDLVARGGAGAWALADAAVSDARTDRDPTYYAGWSLVVVHGTEAADGASVTVHQGGAWIGRAAAAPAFAFVAEAGTRARIGVVAWEGDRGSGDDRLSLSGVGALTPLRWDGTQVVRGGSRANAFDSTATGWRYPNALGVDAKGFEDVVLTSDVGTLTPTTSSDQYLIGVVTVRTVAPEGVSSRQR
ncbi:hypothetical protein E5226_08220 [Cellulomonas shaoxiangyii]|nr:hypothetical protein E5226_08220 [Cellulomonas shaoxiangyii]